MSLDFSKQLLACHEYLLLNGLDLLDGLNKRYQDLEGIAEEDTNMLGNSEFFFNRSNVEPLNFDAQLDRIADQIEVVERRLKHYREKMDDLREQVYNMEVVEEEESRAVAMRIIEGTWKGSPGASPPFKSLPFDGTLSSGISLESRSEDPALSYVHSDKEADDVASDVDQALQERVRSAEAAEGAERLDRFKELTTRHRILGPFRITPKRTPSGVEMWDPFTRHIDPTLPIGNGYRELISK